MEHGQPLFPTLFSESIPTFKFVLKNTPSDLSVGVVNGVYSLTPTFGADLWPPQDRVLYTYGASEDNVALETLSVLGWKLDTLSDVSMYCIGQISETRKES